MPAISGRDLRRMYECKGGRETVRLLGEALREKHLRPDDFSLRDLFVHLVENGDEALRAMTDRKSGGSVAFLEGAQANSTEAFSSITGQIVYNKILEGYENPAFLWPDLFEDMTTTFLDQERIAGIGGTGDVAEVVDENQPYPIVGLNEEFVDFGPALTRGFIIPASRRMIIADRTGLFLKQCADSGYHYLGVNMEKRALDVALGVTNSYKRNLTSTNTYLTSGGYINAQTGNALTSWRSLEAAELLFDAITDPNTGEPIIVSGEMTVIVPTALKMTALRILDVTDIGQVDNSTSTNTIRQVGPNPLKSGKMVHATGMKVLSSAYVKQRTSSATKWFYGQPKKAFLKRTVWNIETQQAASNSEAEFTQDILMRWKVSEMSGFHVQNPRHMTSNDQ